MAAPDAHGRPLGFTLIEVLVVVILVAVIMATVVSSFTGADREQEFKGLVTRIAMRIEMARDRAIQSNNEWAVFVDREQLSFASYDELSQQWLTRPERAFAQENSDLSLRFDLQVEAYPGAITPPTQTDNNTREEEQRIPDLWLFSSGEVVPFELRITTEELAVEPWRLASDGLARVSIERGEL